MGRVPLHTNAITIVTIVVLRAVPRGPVNLSPWGGVGGAVAKGPY